MKSLFVLIIALFLILFSCKKAENRTCWKSNGKMSSLRVDLPEFTHLNLKKGMQFTLVEDDSNYLLISGGENLLNFIEFKEFESQKISIENKNKCNFLRKYSPINVEIHFTNLQELRYEGTDILQSMDTLHFQEFKFEIIDANGSMDLIVDAEKINAGIPYGYGDFTLKGKTKEILIEIKSNGFCKTTDLIVTEEINLLHNSPTDLYINANNVNLKGKIIGKGNVNYYGTPKMIDVTTYSTGKLIQK